MRIAVAQAILGLSLLLALSSSLWATPTTADEAQRVVEGWLSLEAAPLGVKVGGQVKEVKSFSSKEGSDLYYVVYLNPTGFVIVPGDDLVEPIIGFLPEGQYDPSPDNPLGAMVSQDLPGRVLAARQMEKQVQTEGLQLAPTDVYAVAQRKWTMLAKSFTATEAVELGLPSISSVWVAPLVQSTWDQSLVNSAACYNYYTPPGSAASASNYVCGCVATAMAQLMRFWQYPTTGVGTGTYTISINGTATTRNLRGGDGAGGAYNWGSMPLVPNSSITTTQRQAIGALTHDAGVSVNMNYTASSSGTDALKASTAFVNTFGYSNAKNAYNSGNNIPVANRNNMVNPNLDAGYPTLLGIYGSVGGHAIVCDGYGYNSATLYHHLNMGWSGSNNAWYNLPTIDTSWATFDVLNEIVYNVYKTGSGEIISGRVTDTGGTPISGVTVTATGPGGPYTATTNANGIYALPKVASVATYSVSASKTGSTFTPNPQSVTTGISTNLSRTTGNKWGINFTGSVVPTPAISVTPTSLTATSQQGQNAVNQSLTVQNTGGGTLSYTISDNATWLSVNPASGTSTGEPDTIAVIYATSGLTAGTYTGTITVTAPGATGSPKTLGVTLTVTAVHTISASAGSNGTISPAGSVVVNNGDSQTFTLTPSTGYHVADVLVNGASVGAISSYTFTNVTANHTIAASFAIDPAHTITATAGPHGSISPAGAVPVNDGGSQTFTIKPDANYNITTVLVDGVSVGLVSSYAFNNVTGDHTIAATFGTTTISILTDKGQVRVSPGKTAPLQVKLSDEPSTSVVVTAAWQNGSPALSIQGAATLTFTPANWNTYQTVQIAATPDKNDMNATAVFDLSGPGLTGKQVTAVKGQTGINIGAFLILLLDN